MSYNPYNDILEIYKAGNNWQKEQDAEKRKSIQENAKKFYDNLINNGYSQLADELSASGSERRAEIANNYKKFGKTKTRDYLYGLGQRYNMSQSDIDSLIKYDNTTGEISFGGKNIGKPDTVVDGTSYWSDTRTLDNAFNDYVSRSGITRSKSAAVDRENESLFKKYAQEYEDLKKTNPFETEEGRAIMAKYGLAGLSGRDNIAAQGAASNGGNIDSFSAANAMRQQAALYAQGQEAVLDAYQQKLDHARSLLSDMGVNIDRVYNQDETSKNNDVARKSEIASVTGVVPDEWVSSNNPYMNDDGTIKDMYKNADFKQIILDAEAAGNTPAANYARQARYYKIMGDYANNGKYDDGDYIAPEQQKTEAAIQFDEKIAQADRALNAETSMNAANNQNKIDQIAASARYSTSSDKSSVQKPTLTATQAKSALEAGTITPEVVNAYNYWYNTDYYIGDNGSAVSPSGYKTFKMKPSVTNSEISTFVKNVNDYAQKHYGTEKTPITAITKNKDGTYSVNEILKNYVIKRIMEEDFGETDQNYMLTSLGLDEDDVYDFLNQKR